MNIAEYEEHRDSDDGYCTHCKDWTVFGGVEPDAHNYNCPECDNDTVIGAEEVIMEGIINIEV